MTPILRLAALTLAPLSLAACMVRVPASQQPPVAYSQASPYAAPAPGGGYGAAPVGTPVAVDPYCAEAVGVAQDAAAVAATTGRGRDAGRAERTADYARRDCR